MASGVRPGGRQHPRTPANLAKFIKEGAAAPSPQQLAEPEPIRDDISEVLMAPIMQEIEKLEPVSRPRTLPTTYEGPKLDPWQILRNSLPPEALAALEEVTGHSSAPGPGDAPWFRCYDVAEGRPSGHPDFQAIVKPGQHVYCPYVDPVTGTCGRKTVMPLENYVPA